jgi:N-ethylmaleimide reductase
MSKSLFQPIQLGSLTLKNRIVMPPMTRSRASQPGDVANGMMATYYAQRASAGLIVSKEHKFQQLQKAMRGRQVFTHQSRLQAGVK